MVTPPVITIIFILIGTVKKRKYVEKSHHRCRSTSGNTLSQITSLTVRACLTTSTQTKQTFNWDKRKNDQEEKQRRDPFQGRQTGNRCQQKITAYTKFDDHNPELYRP